MAQAHEVVTVGVHEFAGEVLVEVTVRDKDDGLVVHSFPFDHGEDDAVRPDEPVPEPLQRVVVSALAAEGYDFRPETAA